jgi:hypothetical protein
VGEDRGSKETDRCPLTGEMGQGIKSERVNCQQNGSGEGRTFIESKPVGVMMDGHIPLNYPTPPANARLLIPTNQSQTCYF